MEYLRGLLRSDIKDGWDLARNSRAIIGEWIRLGLPYPHSVLNTVVGVESETDHLLDDSNVLRTPDPPPRTESEAKRAFAAYSMIYEEAREQLMTVLKDFDQTD